MADDDGQQRDDEGDVIDEQQRHSHQPLPGKTRDIRNRGQVHLAGAAELDQRHQHSDRCGKGHHMPRFHDAPNRLMHPQQPVARQLQDRFGTHAAQQLRQLDKGQYRHHNRHESDQRVEDAPSPYCTDSHRGHMPQAQADEEIGHKAPKREQEPYLEGVPLQARKCQV